MSVEGKKHLCAIARTSRTLQVEAERLIYRMLAFGQADHVVKLCRLICAVPRLGPYVQLLFCYDRFLVGLAVLGRLLSSAVGRMPNLRCWITANSSYRSNWHSIWTPHHRYPFQLSFPEAHHAPRRNLLAFLETQSSIRELILELGVDDQLTNNQDIVIPPSMVPNLVHLEARLCQNNPLPFHLLPGRPVTHFAIDHLHPMLLRNLSLSVGPLKALRLNGGASYIGPTTLLLPEFAPHLEVISGIGLYILGTGEDHLITFLGNFGRLPVEIQLADFHGEEEIRRRSLERLSLKRQSLCEVMFLQNQEAQRLVLWRWDIEGWKTVETPRWTLWDRCLEDISSK